MTERHDEYKRSCKEFKGLIVPDWLPYKSVLESFRSPLNVEFGWNSEDMTFINTILTGNAPQTPPRFTFIATQACKEELIYPYDDSYELVSRAIYEAAVDVDMALSHIMLGLEYASDNDGVYYDDFSKCLFCVGPRNQGFFAYFRG